MGQNLKKIVGIALALAVTTVGIGSIAKDEKVSAENKPMAKNVIMLIADGMSTEAVTIARWYNNGQPLAMDEISTGAVRTYWERGPITDSAPGGTAYSTGKKTLNKYVGTDSNNKPLATILEEAKQEKKATGLVATSEIPHATPADFSAHIDARSNYDAIIRQQIGNDIDVVLGGGYTYSDPMQAAIKAKGYDYVKNREAMNSSTSNKLWGMFAGTAMAYDLDRENDAKLKSEEPTIDEMTKKAIDVLSKDQDGFFLMVEGSKIDWAAHANDATGIVTDILAFDKAVKTAVDFAKKDANTVVVVTTDHGNSGISIGMNAEGFSYDSATFDETVNKLKGAKATTEKFNAIIKDKDDAFITKAVADYYGITDLKENDKVKEFSLIKSGKINKVISDRAKVGFTTTGHTGEDVYLGVYAPAGIEKLKGIVENTEVNKYMQRVLFGSEKLEALTAKLFIEGSLAFKAPEYTLNLDTKDAKNPFVTVTRGSNTLKLYLYTDIYELNGVLGELDSVTTLIKDKFYVPQQAVELLK